MERFLPRCLDSLLRQGLSVDEYEVICVNDGSPDNSAEILSEYQQKHPDIFQVITQENQGLGGARNTGTAQARGEYVAYLDSDDYVVDEGYARLLETLENERTSNGADTPPDLVIFRSTNVLTDGIKRMKSKAPTVPFSIIGRDDVRKWHFGILGYAWNKLYRRAFLEEHHCHFKSLFCEDELFLHAPHFYVIDGNIYRYEQNNPQSILHLQDRNKLFAQMDDLVQIIGIMNGYLTTHGDESLAMGVKQSNFRLINTYHREAYKAHLSYKEWQNYMKKLKQYPYSKMAKDDSTMGRLISVLKNSSLNSYGLYLITCLCYEIFFKRFIRPYYVTK